MSDLITLVGTNGEHISIEDGAMLVEPKSEFLQAVENGYAFSWSNLSTDINATDTVLCVENNSSTLDLYIEKILLATDASGEMVVHTSSGATMTGTALTGVNLNRNSGYVAPATAKADETGNGQQAASYTGRLYIVFALADQSVQIDVGGAIVLPNDHNIGIDVTAEPTGCNATIIGYFKARS